MIQRYGRVSSRIANISIAFDAGASCEQLGYNAGIAHMLEHCLFKGTLTRTAEQINREIAFLGGSTNAYTSNDMVCYYISVPEDHLDTAMGILSDMIFNSTIPEAEFLREREVVKEEEIQRSDSVDDFISQHYMSTWYDNHLRQPIIGTQESIARFTRDEVERFYKSLYKREAAVVTLVSSYDEAYGRILLETHFGPNDGIFNRNYVAEHSSGLTEPKTLNLVRPEIEHTYVWMAHPSISMTDSAMPHFALLTAIMGAGMDSRLFSEVREKRGLVYGIGIAADHHRDGSSILIEFSTRDKNVDSAVSIINDELTKICSESVLDEELQRAKNKLLASSYGRVETSAGLASELMSSTFYGRMPLDDRMKVVLSATTDDVTAVARRVFDFSRRLTIQCRKG